MKRFYLASCPTRAAGTILLAAAALGASAAFAGNGRVALHTWLTSAEFKDISVMAADGRTLWRGLPDPATCGATAGTWKIADGVYAELVRNRSFEDGLVECRRQKTIGYWHTVGHATIEADTSKPISGKNPTCGRVDALPGGGVANDGYFGIAVKDGAKYRLSVALRGDVKDGIKVSLKTLGATLAKGEIDGIGPEWKTYTLMLEAKGTDPDAKLVFTAPGGGTFWLDCVSLFPCDTYGTSGLFRKDLMERLAALKPSFVRFPGGCWVEGRTMADAYRWKQTIGNVWDRRTQWNIWGYWASNGVGFHEYLVLCEELGAKALFCINCGMSHTEVVPLDKMGEFVQDALDCIEYANGPMTSKWGAVRAANGHPAPFNLRYLEIGNENGGEKYHERYALIHDAVRAKYPEIKIVSDVWHGTVKGRPQHIRDEHYYRSPDWFMSVGAKLYDIRAAFREREAHCVEAEPHLSDDRRQLREPQLKRAETLQREPRTRGAGVSPGVALDEDEGRQGVPRGGGRRRYRGGDCRLDRLRARGMGRPAGCTVQIYPPISGWSSRHPPHEIW